MTLSERAAQRLDLIATRHRGRHSSGCRSLLVGLANAPIAKAGDPASLRVGFSMRCRSGFIGLHIVHCSLLIAHGAPVGMERGDAMSNEHRHPEPVQGFSQRVEDAWPLSLGTERGCVGDQPQRVGSAKASGAYPAL